MKKEGLSAKALQVRVELLRDRAYGRGPTIKYPEDVAQVVSHLEKKDREHFVCIHLSTRNKVLSVETVGIGTLNASLISAREIFKGALLANARAVVIAHNHPSGDPEPSEEDKAVTTKLAEAGEILDIEVLDHVIVGQGKYVSLKERGLV